MNKGFCAVWMSALCVMIAFVPINFSNINSIYAQSNILGQGGDGNEISQSKPNSQETNQNSMCVSGESTLLSCNNLSSEDYGDQRDTNPMQGMIYVTEGPTVTPVARGEASSTAGCNPGDSIISGFFSVSKERSSINFRDIVENLDPENNDYTIQIAAGFEEIYAVKANAVCINSA